DFSLARHRRADSARPANAAHLHRARRVLRRRGEPPGSRGGLPRTPRIPGPGAGKEASVRNVYMWNLMSLDGYFESKPWGLDFHEQAWGEELERFGLDQMATADTLLFGRATYEGMASYWTTSTEQPTADRMNEISKIVFSRTLD